MGRGGKCKEEEYEEGAGVSEWGDRFGGVDWIFFSVSPIQFELF